MTLNDMEVTMGNLCISLSVCVKSSLWALCWKNKIAERIKLLFVHTGQRIGDNMYCQGLCLCSQSYDLGLSLSLGHYQKEENSHGRWKIDKIEVEEQTGKGRKIGINEQIEIHHKQNYIPTTIQIIRKLWSREVILFNNLKTNNMNIIWYL